MQARIERAVSVGQHRIGGDDVEPVVDGAIDAVVAPAGRAARWAFSSSPCSAARSSRSASVTRAAASSPAQAFQRGHDLEGMAHVLARQRHDLDAAIGQLQQQAVGRQQAEGLAQRRARDAELLAELALVQPRARRQDALDDQGAQPLGRRLAAGSSARSGMLKPSIELWTHFGMLYTKCKTHIRKVRRHAPELPSQRPPFPADSRADQRARPHPAGDGSSDHRSPRTRVQRAGQEGAAQRAPGLPDQAAGDRLSGVGHRRVGSGPGEHAVVRRPGADVGDRPLRLAVEEDGRQARHQVGVHGRRLAQAGRSRGHREAPEGRQGPRHQGGLHRPQRDLDRRGERHRRRAPRHRCSPPPCPAAGRHDLLAGLDRLSPRRLGRRRDGGGLAEGPDAAARPLLQRRQREGGRGVEDVPRCPRRSGTGKRC